MDLSTSGPWRRRLALAAAASGLCAALASCTTTTPPTSGSTASNAPNTAGNWSGAQKNAGEIALAGSPINNTPAEAACVVRFAAATESWQDFLAAVTMIQQSGAPIGVVGGPLSQAAAKCAAGPVTVVRVTS
ncbi:hypothetical protein KDK95_11285 [Actinospica sp. MGRD01-02]|uniref:Uncharacterized protein n=1 Tax=Actinospica acidithermotolerans TaxID=2828514 RepID=A0A941IIK5_9ACTN|nr:hypothetical protein [Actinospica acidithermotolerans]MBR7826887.1 hypothetical protein [Actinospica acidithermotolerans]